jgi:nicotinate phosphoribosyltransferase
LLVDTVNTLGSGVPNAITVFDELRAGGHEPVGVRLDSGDLAYLAVQTAQLLDAAGYPDLSIVLSSDLDELNIWQILTQIADDAELLGIDAVSINKRLVYGVGTRLITSHGSGALNGVFKLVGIENRDGTWTPAIKISEDPGKIPLPGRKAVWRLYDQRGAAVVDLIGLADEEPLADAVTVVHHPSHDGITQVIRRADISHIELLHDTVLSSDIVTPPAHSIDELAERCRIDIDRLDIGVRRLVNPHRYHVSLTSKLYELRKTLVADAQV